MSQNNSLNEGRIQPDDDFNDYRCSWEIDLSAQSATDAAIRAEVMMQSGETRIWTVEISGNVITVDLDENEEEVINVRALEVLRNFKPKEQ